MTKEITKSPFSILFVDDEDNARKYFEKGLKNNFSILLASNIEEAQAIIEANHESLAVVITDQRMPGGNGVKLLQFLRENYPHIIRLLTTAYSDLSEAIEAVNSGEILRYIQKPWDFGLLQHEVKQAVELFELRNERQQLLQEKIMVKKKMAKIDRAKNLILIAKTLNFIRFADIAVQNFIRDFSINKIDESDDKGWESFDFGNAEVSEVKFFLSLIEKIQATIPNNVDYGFNDDASYAKLSELVSAEVQKINSAVSVEISQNISGKINHSAFVAIIYELLQIDASNGSIIIDKADESISINLKNTQLSQQKNNIFTTGPDQLSLNFYVNLLICYLLAAHHGGTVETSFDNQIFNCVIKLPDNPIQTNFLNSQSDSVENIILSTMLI